MPIDFAPFTLSGRGTVLVLASNALQMPFDFASEIASIHEAAARTGRFRVAAHWSCPPETVRRLVETEAPEVVHVLAPTVDEENRLWLADRNGDLLKVEMSDVVDLFQRDDEVPRLIVVNTCDSLRLAEALAAHAGSAIGMNGKIWDDCAIAFSKGLYQALSSGVSLAEAFDTARAAVVLEQRHIPVLLKGRINPSKLTIGSAPKAVETAVDGAPVPVKGFCSYAREDAKHLENLRKFLAPLRRTGAFDMWHDRQLQGGQDWSQEIDRNIDLAALMVLLITPDFLNSDYCVGIELKRALDRGIPVIPVVVRPCTWTDEPELNKLTAFPKDAKAVTTWSNKDAAWTDVVERLHEVIETIGEKARSDQSSPGTHAR